MKIQKKKIEDVVNQGYGKDHETFNMLDSESLLKWIQFR